MTDERKKSFLVYFDIYPSVVNLSDAQRGLLFLVMLEYAAALAAGPAELADVMDRHPDLLPETIMALQFIGETIRRDTLRWKGKQAHYHQAALRRAEDLRREKPRDDASWARKYIPPEAFLPQEPESEPRNRPLADPRQQPPAEKAEDLSWMKPYIRSRQR